MHLNKALLFYKRSAYTIHVLARRNTFYSRSKDLARQQMTRLINAHREHYQALAAIERIFKKYKIKYAKCYRGRKVNLDAYDVILSIGGDGTFLEAARSVGSKILIGVNSAPSYSVGKFCMATAANFEEILRRILEDRFKTVWLHRLRVEIENHKIPLDALNDVLICHRNPAHMSRYCLTINGIKEQQHSSGIWVATAAGSSGAIKSAGGRLLRADERKIQYRPRELYGGYGKKYRLTGGILNAAQRIIVTSLMHEGVIFVDGPHISHPLAYGTTMKFTLSPNPLKTIRIDTY